MEMITPFSLRLGILSFLIGYSITRIMTIWELYLKIMMVIS